MDPKTWTITQLEGSQPKSLTLSGYSAPFGRKRHGSVVRSPVETRDTEVYYPDGGSIPTRHFFGVKLDPWELNGRFSDADLGSGGALAKSKILQQFVADQRKVQISWGDIKSATGYLTRYDPGIEAEDEVEWKLTFKPDIDSDYDKPVTVPQQPSVQDHAQALEAFLDTIVHAASVARDDSEPQPSLFDALDDLVSALNSPFAIINEFADQVGSWEKAIASDIRRVRAGINSAQTALLNLRDAFESFSNDQALIHRSGISDAAWSRQKLEAEQNAAFAQWILADMDRAAERAERGAMTHADRVRTGDSWESLATKHYGDPGKADVLRQANGARYGHAPTPGRVVRIPTVKS